MIVDVAKLSELDAACDAQSMSAAVADEVFAVVDVLDASPALRRAFTDPASTEQARVALAQRVFGSKVSRQAADVLAAALKLRWRNGQVLADALERQAVRIVLKAAADAGQLDAVIDELWSFESTVASHNGLREALRDGNFASEHRRELVGTLTQTRVSSFAETLLRRAVAARQRTYVLTLEGYLQLAAQLRQRQIAQVVVARPLTDEQQTRLRAALSAQAGREIDLQVEVDPSVIGGIRVQFGDDRIESTVASRLDDVQRQLSS